LHSAAHAPSKEVAELLLAKKVDIDAKTDDKETPLAIALTGRKANEKMGDEVVGAYDEIIKFLRENGAKE